MSSDVTLDTKSDRALTPRFVSAKPRFPRPLLMLLGLAIAFVSSIAGIGGGLFAVPALYMLWRLPLERAVATSLMLVFANAAASTLTEGLRSDSAIHWWVVAQAIPATLVGAQLGYFLSKRINGRLLRKIFVVVLFAVGARMLISMLGTEEPMGEASFGGLVAAGVPQWVAVAVIGLCGGIASPLLGIGGGLVVVPLLFLSLSGLGFAGARASSLAIAVVSSSRSLWLHARDGRVDLKAGAWLGLGALLGAAGGVQAIHVPGVEAVGQGVLVGTLWIVATRFVFELRSGSTEADRE